VHVEPAAASGVQVQPAEDEPATKVVLAGTVSVIEEEPAVALPRLVSVMP
jgi:hypothetical protein